MINQVEKSLRFMQFIFSVWYFYAVWNIQNILFLVLVRQIMSLNAYIFIMHSQKLANLITQKALLFGLIQSQIKYFNHLWLSPFFLLLAESYQTAHGKIGSEVLELILNRCVKWLLVSEGWVRMHRSPCKHE